MKVETIEIAGFAGALNALRLPFGRDCRSNIDTKHEQCIAYLTEDTEETNPIPYILNKEWGLINPKDLTLMSTLVKRGDEHAKVVRGIVVWAKITAPIYWWCEAETYRAGHERLASESTMHIDCRGLSGEELQQAKAEIPMGKELTKVDFFSYQALRTIVRQRHDHRLKEWHIFVDWIKTLPFADELILAGINLEEEKK